MTKVNLCGAGLKDFINIDASWKADKTVNLNRRKIPMKDNSVDVLICMSAIGYFTKERGEFLIRDVHRILKYGGVCRFGTQDLELICENFLANDPDFKCERINEWFNGYEASGHKSKYVYDEITLLKLFINSGFDMSNIFCMPYQESADLTVKLGQYDNRSEQMFFIEAVK